jgi:hypothetical protein
LASSYDRARPLVQRFLACAGFCLGKRRACFGTGSSEPEQAYRKTTSGQA